MSTIVKIAGQPDLTLPADGLTVEEARRALVSLGYGVATANASVSEDASGNQVITFASPQGGDKGTR